MFDRHGEGSGSGVRWMLDVKKSEEWKWKKVKVT